MKIITRRLAEEITEVDLKLPIYIRVDSLDTTYIRIDSNGIATLIKHFDEWSFSLTTRKVKEIGKDWYDSQITEKEWREAVEEFKKEVAVL